jgi:hypothetical protein
MTQSLGNIGRENDMRAALCTAQSPQEPDLCLVRSALQELHAFFEMSNPRHKSNASFDTIDLDSDEKSAPVRSS